MNAMNMPGFTAETSLYKTSGHYQAGKYAINSPINMLSAVYPALRVSDVECKTFCCAACSCCANLGNATCCNSCAASCPTSLTGGLTGGGIGGVAAF